MGEREGGVGDGEAMVCLCLFRESWRGQIMLQSVDFRDEQQQQQQ